MTAQTLGGTLRRETPNGADPEPQNGRVDHPESALGGAAANRSEKRRANGPFPEPSHEPDRDRDLLAHLAHDLDGSFDELVRCHQDRLFSIALRMTGDPADAEELAQDAFVRAYRALEGYDRQRILEMNLRAWLAKIVVNLTRNRSRAHRALTIQLEPDAAIETRAADESPHERLARREEAARWGALLADLPPRYRGPVILRHVDGLSYTEMAEALDRPEGTLKAQVHRGLVLLRDAFEAQARAEVTR